MTIDAFIICDDAGKPIKLDELPEDATNTEVGITNLPVFLAQADAEEVLNSLLGTTFFEGFERGTIRKVTLTIGDIVVWQDEADEDEDEDEDDEPVK